MTLLTLFAFDGMISANCMVSCTGRSIACWHSQRPAYRPCHNLEYRLRTFEQQFLQYQQWLSGDMPVCSAWFELIERLQYGDQWSLMCLVLLLLPV